MNNQPHHKRFSWLATGVILTLLLLRTAIFWANSNSFVEDPDAYRVIATTLDRSDTYGVQFEAEAIRETPVNATAFRPPLYPWILSWLTINNNASDMTALPPVRVAILHLIFLAITLLATYATARRLMGAQVALIATVLVGIDPILIQQSTLVMTETLAVMLSAVVVWWWSNRVAPAANNSSSFKEMMKTNTLTYAVLGVLLSLSYLCRPTFLVWAGLIAVSGILCVSPRRSGLVIGGSIMILVGTTVLLWTARNVRELGHPVWATTHGGYTLLLGNNNSFYDYLAEGFSWRAWNADPFLNAYQDRHDSNEDLNGELNNRWGFQSGSVRPVSSSASEVEEDQWAANVAKQTILQNPTTFVVASVVRVMRLWSPVPLFTSTRSWISIAAVSSYYVAFYLMLLIAIYRYRGLFFRVEWLPVWMLVITLTLVHSIYWSNLRMRSPAMPGLAIIAATALVRRPDGVKPLA